MRKLVEAEDEEGLVDLVTEDGRLDAVLQRHSQYVVREHKRKPFISFLGYRRQLTAGEDDR